MCQGATRSGLCTAAGAKTQTASQSVPALAIVIGGSDDITAQLIHETWPIKIPIIAHDVGRSNDRSTAVVGGHCLPFSARTSCLVQEFLELPVGMYGSQLANELAKIDQNYNRDCLIVADLSNDATYGETLFETFGRRVIGVQIGRLAMARRVEQRRVKNGVIPVYNVGRTFLLEVLLAEMRDHRIRLPIVPESRRAYEQLMARSSPSSARAA